MKKKKYPFKGRDITPWDHKRQLIDILDCLCILGGALTIGMQMIVYQGVNRICYTRGHPVITFGRVDQYNGNGVFTTGKGFGLSWNAFIPFRAREN